MKKYTAVLTLLMVFAAFSAFSQGTPKKIWTEPAAFKLDEPVTIFIDLEGTVIAGAEEVHMWGWNSGYALDNGEWTASSAETKWTKDAGSTVAYRTVAKFTDLYADAKLGGEVDFLLKAKDGTGDLKTDDLKLKLPDWTVAKDGLLTTIPATFEGTDHVSIFINVAEAYSDGGGEQGQLVGVAQVAAHSGVNGWNNVIESTDDKAHLTDMGDNIWRLDMTPAEFYAFEDEPITEINMLFNNDGDWGKSGRAEGGENFAIAVKEPASSKVRLASSNFPKKFTANDVVTFFFDTQLVGNGLQFANELTVESVEFDGTIVDLGAENVKMKKLMLTHVGGGYFKLAMMPKVMLSLSEEQVTNGGNIKITLTAEDASSTSFEFSMTACE